MKIKEIHLHQFKRFTDLLIKNIPETTKLVVLVGPNGCGKSSLFDSFKIWHMIKSNGYPGDRHYCQKIYDDRINNRDLVKIKFYTNIDTYTMEQCRELFYFRTAYRNSPKIDVTALETLKTPLENQNIGMMIANDDTVNDNYQRLISATIAEFFDTKNNERTVISLRNELISYIREPLHRLFPDLTLTELGLVTEKAEFYFTKGTTHRYSYDKLSGGEKAAFDLLLDFVIKNQYYKNTIFCIDEPETHIHTSLQAKLLTELVNLVNDNSQLWIATHSFGMMKEAKKLSEEHPGEVVFLNFDGFDFDEPVTLVPSQCDYVLWNKMLEITLDDYAPFLSPDVIVFCEGSTIGTRRKDFDATCYTNIFQANHPRTLFYSGGGCNDIDKDKDKNKTEQIIQFIHSLSKQSKIVKLIDLDDRSPDEVKYLESSGIKVLSRRNLESFLMDDSVLKKWCVDVGQPQKEKDLLKIKQQAINASIARGNPRNDLKSAANEICTRGKNLLQINNCGNNGDAIMRDTLSKLITPDMVVYQELERDIFS